MIDLLFRECHPIFEIFISIKLITFGMSIANLLDGMKWAYGYLEDIRGMHDATKHCHKAMIFAIITMLL